MGWNTPILLHAARRAGLDWERHVVVHLAFVRPTEVDLLVGHVSKARRVLGSRPKISFSALVELMGDAHLEGMSSRSS